MSPKQNPSPKPALKKKSKTKVILIIGCVALLIFTSVCGGVGGYFGYTKWYIPKQASDYINATADNFNDIHNYAEEIVKEFPEEDLSDMTEISSLSTEELVKEYDDLIANVTTLLEKVEKAQSEMPEGNKTVEDLDRELREYYDLVYESFKEDKEILESLREFFPVYEKMEKVITDSSLQIDSPSDLPNAASEMRKMAKDLGAFKTDINQIKENEYTKELKSETNIMLDAAVQLYNEIADAIDKLQRAMNTFDQALAAEAEADLEKAAAEADKSLSEFEGKLDEISDKIDRKFDKEIEELNHKYDSLFAEYEAVREKYGLEEES